MLTLDPMENPAWERIREVSLRWVAAEMVVPSWSAAEGKQDEAHEPECSHVC